MRTQHHLLCRNLLEVLLNVFKLLFLCRMNCTQWYWYLLPAVVAENNVYLIKTASSYFTFDIGVLCNATGTVGWLSLVHTWVKKQKGGKGQCMRAQSCLLWLTRPLHEVQNVLIIADGREGNLFEAQQVISSTASAVVLLVLWYSYHDLDPTAIQLGMNKRKKMGFRAFIFKG